MARIILDSTQINYDLVRSKRRKSIGISVNTDGLRVSAPINIKISEIEKLLIKNQKWIFKKIEYFSKLAPKPAALEYQTGEQILFLGKKIQLTIKSGNNKTVKLHLEDNSLIVNVPANLKQTNDYKSKIRNKLIKWYKKQALDYLIDRVNYYETFVGQTPSEINVREYKSRWGTCKSDGRITFNWKVIMAPPKIIDLIVVHEMSHLKIPNHSKAFWQSVEKILPDYKERDEWLKINGTTFSIG